MEIYSTLKKIPGYYFILKIFTNPSITYKFLLMCFIYCKYFNFVFSNHITFWYVLLYLLIWN